MPSAWMDFEIRPPSIVAAGGDEADPREIPRSLAQSDVGDRAFEPIGEEGDSNPGARRWPPVDARLDSRQPLGRELGIGGGRVGPDPERPVELVQGRKPPAEISGTAQGQAIQDTPGDPGSPGRLPARAVGEGRVGQDGAGGEHPLVKAAVGDRPAVDPAAGGQSQSVRGPGGLGEAAMGLASAARHPSPRARAGDEGEKLVRLALGQPPVAAEPELEAGADLRPRLDPGAEAGRRDAELLGGSGRRGPPGIDAGEAVVEIAGLDVAERAPPPPDQAQRCVGSARADIGKGRPPLARVGKDEPARLQLGAGREAARRRAGRGSSARRARDGRPGRAARGRSE